MNIVKVADSADVINQCTENKCISAYESNVPNVPNNELHDNLSSNIPISKIINLISYINQGNRIINDMCEMIEEKKSFLMGSDKPNCRYNASFIINNTINLIDVSENVRNFFLKRKQESCKSGDIQCGELTIILKLIDLINSIVQISSKTNIIDEIFYNLDALSFYELFNLYIKSLENTEILTNITLKRERANSILNRERMRIKRLDSNLFAEDTFKSINLYFGEPIKNSLSYLGNTIGSTLGITLGSVVEGTTNGISISTENKLILFVMLLLFIRR